MSIKPDVWIEKMVQEYGLIEPFEPNLVRSGVISYGLSSYGYDIRVADEFRIFTNVNSTVVDPKNFDANSFVEFQGAICTIPPNSFALARSVEYMRMPRHVTGIVLGKSTYARCFRGDTKVALVDGTSPTLEEMAERFANGEMFWGYSMGDHGRIIVTLLDAPRYIGRDSLLEIKLDNDKVIHCTPDHQFIMRDGQEAAAHNLRPGDSLMPLYRQLARGYEMVYQPINGHLYPTHRLSDEWNLRNGIYEDIPGTHRHHVDHNRLNNAPWNIVRMDASEHIRYHNDFSFGDAFDPEEHSLAIRDAFERLSQDAEWYERFCEEQRNRAIQFWHSDEYIEARETLINKHKQRWASREERLKQSERLKIYWRNNPEQQRLQSQNSKEMWEKADIARREQQCEIMRRVRIRSEITADVVRSALDATDSIRGAARLLQCDRSVFRRFPEVIQAFKGKQKNHSVKSIKEVPGDHDVYCLTVPEAGNFALKAGVFVLNCGIVTNFTPLEAGWEGHITIEISNTTPLPARIYANEGIAQVLFFASDEPCRVSYADRKGKYQGQRGITLPKL